MTRIEVITVIGIVAILGALLIHQPKAKATFLHVNCTGNLKQLGTAAALYEGDNRGKYPGPQPMGSAIDDVSWDRPLAIQLGARLGNDGIYEPLANLTEIPLHNAAKTLSPFSCTIDPLAAGARAIPATGTFKDGTTAGNGICRSYTLNLGTGNPTPEGKEGIGITADAVLVGKVESYAGTVHLIDNQGYATVFGQRSLANDTYMTCDMAGTVVPGDAFTNPLAPMHGEKPKSRFHLPDFGPKPKPRFNVLMYDGHVEMFDQTIIIADGGQVMQYIK
jgi:prepilin-type processing-associated H-X9-DG protein